MADTVNVDMSIGELAGFASNLRQVEAAAAVIDHEYVLYGGAASGGKSYWLRWMLLVLLVEWYDTLNLTGIRVGLFCSDYPALHDRQLSKIRAEFPMHLGEFNEQSREFRLHPQAGGGVICFRNLDDPSKYRSSEFAAIAVDELTEVEESTFDLLRFRLRWKGIDAPKFMAGTNPGGLGHEWVRRLWINRDFPEGLKPKAHEFRYIPAKATDNPFTAESYMKELDSLPTHMRDALRDGSWDVFSGQMFDEFRREVHVCRPFKIPDYWARCIGNDPGFTDPGVWHWGAISDTGDVYIYREARFVKVQYSEQAREVSALSVGEPIDYIVTGMDAYNPHPETGKRIIDYYADGGLVNFRKPVHGAGSKAARAGTLHEYLRVLMLEGKRTAKLHIFEDCKKLIGCIPALPVDPNKPEQVAECAIDHDFDALTYLLSSRHAAESTAPTKPKYTPQSYGAVMGLDAPKVSRWKR